MLLLPAENSHKITPQQLLTFHVLSQLTKLDITVKLLLYLSTDLDGLLLGYLLLNVLLLIQTQLLALPEELLHKY